VVLQNHLTVPWFEVHTPSRMFQHRLPVTCTDRVIWLKLQRPALHSQVPILISVGVSLSRDFFVSPQECHDSILKYATNTSSHRASIPPEQTLRSTLNINRCSWYSVVQQPTNRPILLFGEVLNRIKHVATLHWHKGFSRFSSTASGKRWAIILNRPQPFPYTSFSNRRSVVKWMNRQNEKKENITW
jgi:hypothetical protein